MQLVRQDIANFISFIRRIVEVRLILLAQLPSSILELLEVAELLDLTFLNIFKNLLYALLVQLNAFLLLFVQCP